jgi:hypothetical protein
MVVSGQRHVSAALYPRESTAGIYLLDSGLGEVAWTQRLEGKSFASAGFRTTVVQSVVRHCTEPNFCFARNVNPL